MYFTSSPTLQKTKTKNPLRHKNPNQETACCPHTSTIYISSVTGSITLEPYMTPKLGKC